jgi:dTDP-4-dehydrorhamnose reductase
MRLEPVRILITGASGQLGRALAAELASFDEIIAADRAMLDLARPETMAGVLDALRPDFIVNAAAYTAVDQAESEPGLALKINAGAVGALGAWAAVRRAPIIHFSTDYVFDGEQNTPYREDDPVNPLSVYGKSKAAGERLLLASGAPALIIRTSWVYAASGRNFLTTIIRLARERDNLRIVADQIGAPTSARQIARFVAKVFAGFGNNLAAEFHEIPSLVHFTASGEICWHGFACAIAEGLKTRGIELRVKTIAPIPSAEWQAAAKRPRNSRLSLERARHTFGVAPSSWQMALDDELDRLAPQTGPSAASLERAP